MSDCDIHKNILDVSVVSVDTLNIKLLVRNKYQPTRKKLICVNLHKVNISF